MIDVTRPAEEAARLEDMGVLDVTYKNGGGLDRTAKLVCIGHGVDGKERDFLLFVGPYGMQNKHTYRAITVEDIVKVELSETQSFDRYNMKGKRKPGHIGTPRTRGATVDSDDPDFFRMRTRER